jgi:hypothetical protein
MAPASLRTRLLPLPLARLSYCLHSSLLAPQQRCRATERPPCHCRLPSSATAYHHRCSTCAQLVVRAAPPRLPPSCARAIATCGAWGKAHSSVSPPPPPRPFSPALAILAAPAHRHDLCLPPSFAFSLRIPCSPRPAGILPLAMVMAHRSSGRAHQSELLRGLHPSILLLIHFSRARAPYSRGEARRPHHASHLGRCWPGDGGPSHRVAMHAGKFDAELIWSHARHPRLRLVMGNRVEVTSVTGELTSGENAAVSSRCV